MKKLLIAIFLVCLCSAAEATPIKKASETFSMDIRQPLDSAGIPGAPDSMHIITYADNGSGTLYNARSTTAPFSDISIDTTNQYGSVKYILVDAIGDLDGAGGNFLLTVKVAAWYKKLPTYTFGKVQVISDSLNTDLSQISDIHDTLKLYDTRLDSLMAALSDAAIGDKVWTDGSRAIRDEITDIHDTLKLYDTRLDSLLAALADGSISDKVWVDGSPTIRGEISATIDSIELYDTRFQFLMDSLQAVLDSIQIKFADRTAFDPTSDSTIVDVSAANTAGNLVDKIAATAADSNWNEINTGATHNIATSTGRQLRELADAYVLSSGTAQGGGANHIILAAAESAIDNQYNSSMLFIAGGTGVSQTPLHISDYTGATDSAYFEDTWVISPDGTSEYIIIGNIKGHVDVIHDGTITEASIAGDAITAAKIAANAITGSEAPLLDTILAELDTLRILNTYISGARALTGRDSDTDTLHFYNGATKIMTWLLWHVGGATGDSADSVTVQ